MGRCGEGDGMNCVAKAGGAWTRRLRAAVSVAGRARAAGRQPWQLWARGRCSAGWEADDGDLGDVSDLVALLERESGRQESRSSANDVDQGAAKRTKHIGELNGMRLYHRLKVTLSRTVNRRKRADEWLAQLNRLVVQSEDMRHVALGLNLFCAFLKTTRLNNIFATDALRAGFLDESWERILPNLKQSCGQSIALVLHAHAAMRWRPRQAHYAALLARAGDFRGFDSQSLANIIVAVSKLDLPFEDQTLKRWMKQFSGCRHSGDLVALSSTLHALSWGKLCRDVAFLNDLSRKFSERVYFANARSLTTYITAMKRLRVTTYTSQEFAAWAKGPDFGRWKQIYTERMTQLNAQEFANCIHAIASMKLWISAETFELWERCFRARLEAFKPQEVAMSFWAITRMTRLELSQKTLDAWQRKFVESRALGYRSSHLTGVLFALSRRKRALSPVTLDTLQRALESRAHLCDTTDIANAAWGLAYQAKRSNDVKIHPSLLSALSRVAMGKADQFSPREQCGLRHAARMLGGLAVSQEHIAWLAPLSNTLPGPLIERELLAAAPPRRARLGA